VLVLAVLLPKVFINIGSDFASVVIKPGIIGLVVTTMNTVNLVLKPGPRFKSGLRYRSIWEAHFRENGNTVSRTPKFSGSSFEKREHRFGKPVLEEMGTPVFGITI